MRILKEYNDTKPYIATVSKEADKNKNCLGFFANSVYEDFARKNNIWVLVNDNFEYIGHIMFSIAWHKSKITVNQTYILPQYRKLNYAKLLIKELKEWAEDNYITEVRANVADDLFAANAFYSKMGFKAIKQKNGGVTTHRKINVRICYLNTPTLFNFTNQNKNNFSYNQPINHFSKYVLDLNILIDFIQNRKNKTEVEYLIKHSLNGIFTLAVTPEAKVEINRNTKKYKQDPLIDLINNIPTLKIDNKIEQNHIFDQLKQIIFGEINLDAKSAVHKISDLNHLTYCILCGCTGFITRDNDLLNKSDIIYKRFGLEINSIEEFIYSDASFFDEVTEIDLNNTQYFFENISNENIQNIKNTDINFKREDIALQSFNGVSIKDINNKYLAFAVWSSIYKDKENLVSYIFASETCNCELLDHLLETILRFVKQNSINSIAVLLSKEIGYLDNILKLRGFTPSNENNGFIKYSHLIMDKIITKKTWENFCNRFENNYGKKIIGNLPNYDKLKNTGILIESNDTYNDFFQFETLLSPSIIVAPKRDVFIIPIKTYFARELFGDNFENQRNLFSTQQKPALLKTEKAYFRSRGGCKIKKGDLVIFYVSAPISAAVAVARVTYSDILNINDARDILKFQGVLDYNQLESISKDEYVDTLTFDNLHMFTKNVDIKELKQMNIGKNSFVTAFSVNDDQFIDICKKGKIYE